MMRGILILALISLVVTCSSCKIDDDDLMDWEKYEESDFMKASENDDITRRIDNGTTCLTH